MEAENKSIEEVKSPLTRAKLEGIQELVFDVDKEIKESQKGMTNRYAYVEAGTVIHNLIMAECLAIQARVDKDRSTMEEAKKEMTIVTRMAGRVKEQTEAWRKEHLTHQGKLAGLNRLAEMARIRFEAEVMKADRHARMEAEDAEFRGTPQPEKKGKGKRKKKG